MRLAGKEAATIRKAGCKSHTEKSAGKIQDCSASQMKQTQYPRTTRRLDHNVLKVHNAAMNGASIFESWSSDPGSWPSTDPSPTGSSCPSDAADQGADWYEPLNEWMERRRCEWIKTMKVLEDYEQRRRVQRYRDWSMLEDELEDEEVAAGWAACYPRRLSFAAEVGLPSDDRAESPKPLKDPTAPRPCGSSLTGYYGNGGNTQKTWSTARIDDPHAREVALMDVSWRSIIARKIPTPVAFRRKGGRAVSLPPKIEWLHSKR